MNSYSGVGYDSAFSITDCTGKSRGFCGDCREQEKYGKVMDFHADDYWSFRNYYQSKEFGMNSKSKHCPRGTCRVLLIGLLAHGPQPFAKRPTSLSSRSPRPSFPSPRGSTRLSPKSSCRPAHMASHLG